MGDLVRVEWFDASVGESLSISGAIDMPVKSWGIYLGVLGERNNHLILAQNSFYDTPTTYTTSTTPLYSLN